MSRNKYKIQSFLILYTFFQQISTLNQKLMEYGKICAHLQRQGRRIGAMDMLIAAHAKSEDLILVTNNLREFKRVPQLKLENWTE